MNTKEKKIETNLNVILKMIDDNQPKAEICRLLKIKQDTLNRYLKKYNITYSGNPNRKGKSHSEQIISYKEYTENNKRVTSSYLRGKLISQGVKEKKCEICGLDTWMGKPIPLELHHIDRDRFNNSLQNLMILCSNCHMQEHGYSNFKEKKQKKEKIFHNLCKSCKKDSNDKIFCSECQKNFANRNRKVDRPPINELLDEVKLNGYSATGRKYGVSDNAIRKWLKISEKK